MYNSLEDALLASYRMWAATDPNAVPHCNRVLHESQQRRAVLSSQLRAASPTLQTLARDVLQLERYRLDPPPTPDQLHVPNPAHDFLSTTRAMLQELLSSLQHEQSVLTQQRRLHGAMQLFSNRRAQASDDLSWLAANQSSLLSSSPSSDLRARLLSLLSSQLPRWSARRSALLPSLLPFLELLSRLVRSSRGAFALVSRHAADTDVSREAARLRHRLDALHAMLTALVQQPTLAAGRVSDEQLEPLRDTARLYARIADLSKEETMHDPGHSNSDTPLLHLSRRCVDALLRLPGSIHAALSTVASGSSLLLTSSSPSSPSSSRRIARSGEGEAALARVREKLCGVERVWPMQPLPSSSDAAADAASPHASRVTPLSVEQQVQLLMREARRAENLARLYEGWAPWI